jgi:preprotein translocase subunit SecE
MRAGRDLQRAELVLVGTMVLAFIGLIAFLLWLIDLGFHTG